MCSSSFESRDGIEITPEMIEAGARAFYIGDWAREPGKWTVVRVYRAMESARRSALKRSASFPEFLSRSEIEGE